MSARVLVADDDHDVQALVRLTLELEGFEVEVVADGLAALDRIAADPPAVAVLDIAMPGVDGVEVVRRLRANPSTVSLPVLLLTGRARSADKVAGLTAGADDYVVKPFDTAELAARIRTTLRRTADVRAVSPLTGLPGNAVIERELSARLAAGRRSAVCHVDLDEFKSFNDAYGFLRGDGLLLALAGCLVQAGADEDPPVFVGHIGGDDFVLLCTPEQAEPVARRAAELFDRTVHEHYDPADLERGHLLLHDRRGELRPHPIVSVSIGIAWSDADDDADARATVAAASEMKRYAKTQPGSWVAVDRRR